MKIEIIGGVEYEVGSAPHTKAVQERAAAETAAQVRMDAADRFEGENATLRAQVAEMKLRQDGEQARVAAAVTARIALAAAGVRAGVEVREDMSDLDIQRAVVGKLHPAVDLKDKPEAFVQAAYEIAIASMPSAAEQVREDADRAQGGHGRASREDADDGLPPDERARRSMIKKVRSAASSRAADTTDKR